MPTVNETLRDEAIRRHIELQHYSNATVRKIIAILNQANADLVAALNTALEQGYSETTVQRIDALLNQVRTINVAAYHQAGLELTGELAKFAAHEATAQTAMMSFALPAPIAAKVALNTVSAEQVRVAAMARPFQGRLLKEWMADLADARAKKIRDAVRMGFVEGKTTSQIVRDIRGTRAANYADGLLERPRKDLETIVRTAISHTASVARDATAQANADLVKAVQWLSTLDTRTTIICITHDGKKYTLDHKPIGHSLPWLGGPGQAHFNCRSTSVYVTKSWKELGINLDELNPETRASMDGQVPAETTYADWLAKQPMSRVIDVLGPTRAELYKAGKLDLTRFVNDKGKLLTLEELKARDAAAFAAIGL